MLHPLTHTFAPLTKVTLQCWCPAPEVRRILRRAIDPPLIDQNVKPSNYRHKLALSASQSFKTMRAGTITSFPILAASLWNTAQVVTFIVQARTSAWKRCAADCGVSYELGTLLMLAMLRMLSGFRFPGNLKTNPGALYAAA